MSRIEGVNIPIKTKKQQDDEWKDFLKKMGANKPLTAVEAGRAIPKTKIKNKRRKAVMKKHK